MKNDIFFSICQSEVDGFIPSERQMFDNFFKQLELADELDFDTAWVAETHLSCEVQKELASAVIPHFKGEIGLNTDIFQLAMVAASRTKRINFGSAIRNILCNGGPLAHAEALKTFLTLAPYSSFADRKLYLGFAAGRFPFSIRPYGILPRNELEEKAWPVAKGLVFRSAVEIFLRTLKGESLASSDIDPLVLLEKDFKPELWESLNIEDGHSIPHFFEFEKVGVIPNEPSMDNLQLVLGSHDPITQIKANEILPCWVFNLSITPDKAIDQTHARMEKHFHSDGGTWHRSYMPRTCLLFVDGSPSLSSAEQTARAKKMAVNALENYWRAMEGTLDPRKVENAVENAIYGCPERVVDQIQEHYHKDDRLMLWFDFNCHDNDLIESSMRVFNNLVAPKLPS